MPTQAEVSLPSGSAMLPLIVGAIEEKQDDVEVQSEDVPELRKMRMVMTDADLPEPEAEIIEGDKK